LAGCLDGLRGVGEDHVHGGVNELGGKRRQSLGFAAGEAKLKGDVAPLGPAQFLQSLLERAEAPRPFRIALGEALQHADPPHALALLRAHRERPRHRRTTEQRDELAPPHSITSSARTNNVIGNSMPIALAAFRLTISSNFVGCSTGRLEGLAPRKILST